MVSRTARMYITSYTTSNDKVCITKKVTRSEMWSMTRNTTSSVTRREDVSVMLISKMASTPQREPQGTSNGATTIIICAKNTNL